MTIAHIFNGELGFDVRTKLNDVIDIANAGGGGGTIILGGAGPPADALGSVGDYYVDEDGNQLYGPKVAPGVAFGPDQYAIPSSLAPGGLNGGNIEISNRVTVASAGQVVAVRYLRDASTSQVARKVNVWSTGGTRLSSGTVSNDGGGSGWKQITLTTPVSLTAGDTVLVSVNNSDVYGRTDSPTFPISDGGAASIIAGSYSGTVDAFPGTAYAANFFVDVVYQAEVPSVVWPIAIDGDAGGPAIGNPVISGASGGVLLVDSSGNLAQDSTFTWDSALNDLHIGGAYYVSSARALYVIPNVTENNWFEGNAGNQTVSGYGNFGTGDLSLASLTSGYDNVSLGTNASRSLTSGYLNFALGSDALRFSVTDFANTAIGTGALKQLGVGGVGGGNNSGNVAMGYAALNTLEQGLGNIAIGYLSLGNITAPTIANRNVIIGSGAGFSLGTGGGSLVDNNTFIGPDAGKNISGGSRQNTLIGGWQGLSATMSNKIAISEGAGLYGLLDCNLTENYGWSFNMTGTGQPSSVHIYNMQSPAYTTDNYERGILDWHVTANVFTIGTQASGSGVKRLTAIDAFAKAGAPAAADLPSGCFALIDDTSGGATWLVFNKSGTIRKVQLT